MDALERLKRANERLALLAHLALKGLKPVSQINGYEGPEKKTKELLESLGLEVELKQAGCRTDILFGTPEGMEAYFATKLLRGNEKLYRRGLAFGYPECCAKFFADLISGEREGEPKKEPPLEHFICPGCKESPKLLRKYREAEKEI